MIPLGVFFVIGMYAGAALDRYLRRRHKLQTQDPTMRRLERVYR